MRRALGMVTLFVAAAAPLGAEKARLAWAREGFPLALGERLEDLPAGSGCLAAWPEGRAPRWGAVDLAKNPEQARELLAGQAGATVRGTVSSTDLATYVPEVRLKWPSSVPPLCRQALEALGFAAARVDRGGTFQLGPVPPGRWEVEVTAPYHEPLALSVEVPAGKDEVRLPLVRLAAFGEVRVETVTPLPEGSTLRVVEVRREEGGRTERREVLRQQLKAADATVIRVAPGAYLFQVLAEDVLLWSQRVPVVVGEQAVRVKLSVVRVRGVVRRGESPVPQARLQVAAGEEFKVDVVADAKGGFALTLPQPERYLVEVHLPTGGWQPVLLDVRDALPGEEVSRDLVLAQRWLQGVVRDRRGSPLLGAKVAFRMQKEDPPQSFAGNLQADGEGRFTVPLEEGVSLELRVGGVPGYLPASFFWPASPPEELTVILEEGVEVRGVVVGRGSVGEKAVVAAVQDLFGEPTFRTRCAPDGSFQLTVPRGSWLVAWTSESLGWALAQPEVTVPLWPLEEPSRFRLTAENREPLGRVRVALAAEDGRPIPSWVLTDLQRGRGARPVTDAGGDLVLAGVPPGGYDLLAQDGSGRRWQGRVMLPTTGTAVLARTQQ